MYWRGRDRSLWVSIEEAARTLWCNHSYQYYRRRVAPHSNGDAFEGLFWHLALITGQMMAWSITHMGFSEGPSVAEQENNIISYKHAPSIWSESRCDLVYTFSSKASQEWNQITWPVYFIHLASVNKTCVTISFETLFPPNMTEWWLTTFLLDLMFIFATFYLDAHHCSQGCQ